MRKLLVIMSVVAFLFSCKTSVLTKSAEQNQLPLDEQVWVLSTMKKKPVKYSVDHEKVTIRFALEAKTFSGGSGCNRYFGKFEEAEGVLSMTHIGATKMLCPEMAMSTEREYLQLLSKVNGYELSQDNLILKQGTKPLLEFIPESK